MKRPIRTLNDLRQHRSDINRIVKKYGGRNVRVLDITSKGDLDLSENSIRLLIDFPDYFRGLIPRDRQTALQNELLRSVDRWFKFVILEELPKDERQQMLDRAKPL